MKKINEYMRGILFRIMVAVVLARIGWLYVSEFWPSRSPGHTGMLTQSSSSLVGHEAQRK